MAKNQIVETSLVSWLGREHGQLLIHPRVHNQRDLSAASCVHHSFCPAVETLDKIVKGFDNGHTIDLRWLIRTFQPPMTVPRLVDRLKQSTEGKIKATDCDEYPFKVSGCSFYRFGDDPDAKKNWDTVLAHLKEKGPVLGSFYPDINYNPGKDGIYVSEHKPRLHTCVECNHKRTVRHCVCVVGFGTGLVNGEMMPCLQYLESEKRLSEKGDGVCYMTMDSMLGATIVHL